MHHALRKYEGKDGQGVKELILSILTNEYPFDKKAYSDSDLDRIGEVYGGKRESFFVIEEEGAVVGTVGVKEDSETDALLRRLFVDLKHRKRGYGTQLLDRAVDFCRQNNYKRIYFRCTDRMSEAMKLCKSKGFVETETLDAGGFKIHKLEMAL